MSRAELIKTDLYPYHITARTFDQRFFKVPISDVWVIMCGHLLSAHRNHGLAIHAFVLMGNHFHLLCRTTQLNIDEVMMIFMRNTTLQLSSNASIRKVWARSYHWSVLDHPTHYEHVYKYIFQNPIRVGLTKRVEDYPYSSVLGNVPFPLHASYPLGFGGIEGELIWLNDLYEDEDAGLIKLGLRKSLFGFNQKKLKASKSLKLKVSKF